MHPSIIPQLEGLDLEVDYRPEINREETLEIIPKYWAIIVRSKLILDKAFFEAANSLKVVCRAGAGLDSIDIKAANESGVEIINAPEGNRNALAEHALGMLLSLLNNIPKGNKEVGEGIWDREGNRGHELSARTVGIIGFGNMGRAFASLLSSFGCKILCYDLKQNLEIPNYVKLVKLDDIYKECDVISFHIPLTEESRFWIDETWLSKLRNKVWLINTARGEILKSKDLLNYLKKGRVLGAALDVLENEKISKLAGEDLKVFRELSSMNNVILTPHVGGWSFESYEKINSVLVGKIERFILQNG